MAPALELGTTLWHGYCDLQAVMLISGLILQNHDFSRQTPWIQPVRCLFDLFLACHAFLFSLSLAVRFSVCFLTLSTDRYFAKCSSATSVLNEFFNMSQNFVDHRIPLLFLVENLYFVSLKKNLVSPVFFPNYFLYLRAKK